jgi:hypothetical protein
MVNVLDAVKACGAFVYEREPFINSGGCAVYAAHVARRLKALGVPVWARVADFSRRTNLAEARRALHTNNRNARRPFYARDWNGAGVGFNHVLIQFAHGGDVWTHDAENTEQGDPSYDPTLGNPMLPGYMTTREVWDIASRNEREWNTQFPRDTGIPLIREAVNKFLPRGAAYAL